MSAARCVCTALLALLLAFTGAASAQQPANATNTDAAVRQALLAQRDAITNWEAFSQANSIVGWSESEPNVCKWSGVNCTADGTVYRLDLGCDVCLHCEWIGQWDFNLCAQPLAQGSLAPGLANLSTLKQLYIKGQNISGRLPDEWAADGAFPSLTDLPLENNSFTGTLPASWGRPGAFPNVWRIWLHDNNLTGTLPASWGGEGALKNLTWLRLFNNDLSGSLPAEWGQDTAFQRMKGNDTKACPKGGGLLGSQKCEIDLANNTALCGTVPAPLAPLVCAEDKGDEEQLNCTTLPDGTEQLSSGPCAAAPSPAPAGPTPSPSPSPLAPSPSPELPPSQPPSPSDQGKPPSPPPADGGDTGAASAGSDSGGSSTNTGAIVGGVIAGIVVVGAAAFIFVKVRGRKARGWRKEALDEHGLPVHQAPAAGTGSTTGGAVYQPARLPAAEADVPSFDGVEAPSK